MKSTFRWPPSRRPAVPTGRPNRFGLIFFPGLWGAAFLLRMFALCIQGLISKKVIRMWKPERFKPAKKTIRR